jgi:DNA-binding protein HU-beta
VNKSDLIDAMAEAAGLTKADTERALAAFIDTVTEAVASGDKVTLVGFGAFSVTDRKARTGRNPATGGVIKIAASKAPKFSAGAAFKSAVNTPAKKKGK